MSNPILESTLRDLLDADFAFSPVTASGYGLTEYDDRMDDVSADALRARGRRRGGVPDRARRGRRRGG